MTQEEKQLLIKDLCARLPYGVKVRDVTDRTYELTLGNSYLIDLYYDEYEYVEVPIRPYLRPFSSMTQEEFEEHFDDTCIKFTDWCLEHHFDWRKLIEQGLAIKAPEGMYD